MSKVLIWQVQGMTCKSCERRVGDVLKNLEGVTEVEVSVKMKKVAIRLREDASEPSMSMVNAKLSEHGYQVFPETCAMPSIGKPWSRRFARALIALAVLGLVLAFLRPLQAYIPSASAGLSIGGLMILGLVASMSTCLASTGGFMLAYSAEVQSKKKMSLMHVGRLVTFVVGGGLLGAIGGALPQGSVVWYGVLALILGIGFLIVSLNLLELSPSWSQLGFSLPSKLEKWAMRVHQRPGRLTPFLIGATTFILPCGFTQTAQALALASGSAMRGSLMMGAFALGTFPVLVGLTSLATKQVLQNAWVKLGVGAMLFLFALGQIDGGLTVLGSRITIGSLAQAVSNPFSTAQATSTDEQGVQVVRMKVTGYGYEPSSFNIKKGVPVRWEVNGDEAGGCSSSIVARSLGIRSALHAGLNLFTFTPTEAGVIPFSCGMGMIRGSFTVES